MRRRGIKRRGMRRSSPDHDRGGTDASGRKRRKRCPRTRAPIYEAPAMHRQPRLASLSRRERDRGEISLQPDLIYRDLAQTLRKDRIRNCDRIAGQKSNQRRGLAYLAACPGFYGGREFVSRLCRIIAACWWSETAFLANGLLKPSRPYCGLEGVPIAAVFGSSVGFAMKNSWS
jgi:hypothetical protein